MSTATRRRTRSSYRSLLGPSPTCRPGDTVAARKFAQRVRHLLTGAAYDGRWSHTERKRLRETLAKWVRRADGKDARFLVCGTSPGRLDAKTEHRLQILQTALDGQDASTDAQRARLDAMALARTRTGSVVAFRRPSSSSSSSSSSR